MKDALKAVAIIYGVNFTSPYVAYFLGKSFTNKQVDPNWAYDTFLNGVYYTLATSLSFLIIDDYTNIFKR